MDGFCDKSGDPPPMNEEATYKSKSVIKYQKKETYYDNKEQTFDGYFYGNVVASYISSPY